MNLSLIPSKLSSESAILSAPRYNLRPSSDRPGFVLVQDDRDGPGFVSMSLERARAFVRAARADGMLPRDGVTYRRVLRARGSWRSYVHSAVSVAPWADVYVGDWPSRYDIREWCLDARSEALADPDVRAIAIAYASGDEHTEAVNRETIQEADADDGAVGFIGGNFCLLLDRPARAEVLECLERLESYPSLDDEEVSAREWNEDAEAWIDWGRKEVLEALEAETDIQDSGFVLDIGTNPEAETIDDELIQAASDGGRSSESDTIETARRWIGIAWGRPSLAEVDAKKVAALAELIQARVVRIEDTNPEEPLADRIRSGVGFYNLRTESGAAEFLASIVPDVDWTADDILARAIVRVATSAAERATPALPGLE